MIPICIIVLTPSFGVDVDDGCQGVHDIANPCQRYERYGCINSSSEDGRSSSAPVDTGVVCYGADNGLNNGAAYWTNCLD
ncbi:hypothetical protein DPV78_006775 [Talaromyces pinophilus]|nr:hypothetical protein DPV78_006775 [Talaromyces pinophilus]